MNENYSTRQSFLKLIKLTKTYYLWYIFLCAVSLIISFLEIVRTEAFRRIINGVSLFDKGLLKQGFMIGLLASVALPILTFLVEYFSERLNYISTKKLQLRIFSRILRMHKSDYNHHSSGDLIARINDSAAQAQSGVNTKARKIFEMIMKILFSIAYLSFLNIKLTIGCFIILAGIPVFSNFLSKPLRQAFRKSIMASAEISTYAQDVIQDSETIKTYTLEDKVYQNFSTLYKKFLQGIRQRLFYLLLLIRSRFLVIMGGLVFIYGYGGLLALRGQIDVGSLVAFSFLYMRVAEPVNQLLSIWPDFQGSLAHGSRIFEILDKPEETDFQTDEQIIESRLKNNIIELKDVNFAYNSQRVLQEVSFTANPGEVTILIGASGCGKTTILELISRNYAPENESIYYGNLSINQIPLAHWRQKIAYLNQEPYLFSDTIFENIRFGNLGASPSDVYKAAKTANIHDFIVNLPDGYATRIGDGHNVLSGGQKQRLAIARAFIRNPQIILLDEPFYALDNENVALVQKALEKLMQNKTVIAATHNLHLIKRADKILQVTEGRVQEITFDEVVKSLSGSDDQ